MVSLEPLANQGPLLSYFMSLLIHLCHNNWIVYMCLCFYKQHSSLENDTVILLLVKLSNNICFLSQQKAGGDIKKKGKPDPYAYVPFNFTSLNKR